MNSWRHFAQLRSCGRAFGVVLFVAASLLWIRSAYWHDRYHLAIQDQGVTVSSAGGAIHIQAYDPYDWSAYPQRTVRMASPRSRHDVDSAFGGWGVWILVTKPPEVSAGLAKDPTRRRTVVIVPLWVFLVVGLVLTGACWRTSRRGFGFSPLPRQHCSPAASPARAEGARDVQRRIYPGL